MNDNDINPPKRIKLYENPIEISNGFEFETTDYNELCAFLKKKFIIRSTDPNIIITPNFGKLFFDTTTYKFSVNLKDYKDWTLDKWNEGINYKIIYDELDGKNNEVKINNNILKISVLSSNKTNYILKEWKDIASNLDPKTESLHFKYKQTFGKNYPEYIKKYLDVLHITLE